uniref:Uncharacterized protein n=1 Tax=Plectus sambesii TaxID=2011161 RepID=A0A914W9X2_9BILA
MIRLSFIFMLRLSRIPKLKYKKLAILRYVGHQASIAEFVAGRGVLRIPALKGAVLQPPSNPMLPSACEASRDSRFDWSNDALPARADEPVITRIETSPLDPTDFASCNFVLVSP